MKEFENLRRPGSRRLEIIDLLRGLALIAMVIHHISYDILYIFGRDLRYMSPGTLDLVQVFSSSLFISLAGFSINLSRKPARNGLKIILLAYLLSLVTFFLGQDLYISFGILHMLGFSILLTSFFLGQGLVGRKPGLGLVISLAIFLILRIYGLDILPASQALRKYNLYVLGFYGPSFRSADYFPLLPWYFLFLAGFFLARIKSRSLDRILEAQLGLPKIRFLGRNSLAIYLVHQPLIYLILSIFFK